MLTSVCVGVYLPSNPDSVVVEIDKESGTPMQRFACINIYSIYQCGQHYSKQACTCVCILTIITL